MATVAGGIWLPGIASAEEAPTLPASTPQAAPPLPAWYSEFDPFPEGLFNAGKNPVIRWQPLGPKTDPSGSSLTYPKWLSGTWQVKHVNQGVHFPVGFGSVGTSAAGIEKGSALRLPDVNAEPGFGQTRWRFVADKGGEGVHADWIYTLTNTLTGFLDTAEVVRTRQAETLNGAGLEVTYTVPGSIFGGSRQERTAALTWLAADTWQDPRKGAFLSVEWLRQRGQVSSPTDVFDYKVLTTLRRIRDDQIVGLVRVASFLQPTDEKYVEAGGQPVAVFEHQVYLKPAPLGVV